jgi:hypothetical protein
MFARLASLALAACACSATDAFGQVYYGGYNLGPDYGSMINQALAQQNAAVQAAQNRAHQAIEQAMQNPRCQAMYQQHRQHGGQTSLRDFAYWFVATNGGDAAATRRYMESERNNQRKEQNAWFGLQMAQEQSRQAMSNWQEGYRQNQQEQGNIMTGRQSYTDPSGQRHLLPYTQPGIYRDANTGVVYGLDQFGRYYMRDVNGYWTELTR